MRWFHRVKHFVRRLRRREEVEQALDEEVGGYFEVLVERGMERGLSRQEALCAARVQFGDTEHVKEAVRDVRAGATIETVLQDMHYAWRGYRRNPGFTAAALLTLALGIGVNTAMYSIVHAVLLRPLDVREPDRLVRVFESNAGRDLKAFSASVPNYLSWKEQAHTLDVAVFQAFAANWNQDRETERLEGTSATASFFPVFGVKIRLGRWFNEEEQRPGQRRVVVLSEPLWKSRFGEDEGVIGRQITLNGEPYAIVGVTTGNLSAAPGPWIPLVIDQTGGRGNRQFTVIGRLRRGFTVEQAQAEMASIAGGLAQAFPESNKGWSVAIVPLMRWLVPAETRTALLVVLGAVVMVLLIACANVANLLVAKAEARRKEIAIRAALGAGAGRISRQLLTESVLLSLSGGGIGLILASVIVELARRSLVEILPRAGEIAINSTVLAFALGLSVITGLLFGMMPLLQLGKLRSVDALHQGGRTSGAAPRAWLRSLLVVAQLSLATLLLVGAGLLVQSAIQLQRVSLGFDPDSVLTARISPPRAQYPDAASISSFLSRLATSLESAPGVEAVGVSNAVPLGSGSTITATAVADGSAGSEASGYGWRSADAGYFAVLRIPLLRGRLFRSEDGAGERRVFVLGHRAALGLYGNSDPIGRQLRLNGDAGEVVGVVGDVRTTSIADPPERIVYVPVRQGGRFGAFAVFVRTKNGTREAVGSLIRERLREVEPLVPAYSFRTMAEWVGNKSAPASIRTGALALLASVSLALAMIGIYGVLAYLVTLRRREFGIRLALGARPGTLVALVLWRGLGLAVVGVVLGGIAAFLATRVLERFLFGVAPRDPMTFLAVAILLLIAALLACYLPARRAALADPTAVMRTE